MSSRQRVKQNEIPLRKHNAKKNEHNPTLSGYRGDQRGDDLVELARAFAVRGFMTGRPVLSEGILSDDPGDPETESSTEVYQDDLVLLNPHGSILHCVKGASINDSAKITS
jgi:hypothetical protein